MNSNKVHPAWQKFIDFCRKIGHGEVAKLQVQDGLPVSAESVKTKVKFN